MRFETEEGHLSPVHRGLHVRVDGPAVSLVAARDEFPAVAGGIGGLVGLAANAFAGHPAVLSAYECTPGLSQREVYLAALPMPIDLPLQSRSVPTDPTGILFQRLMDHEAVGARLGRAIGHYHRALEDWHPSTRLQFVSDLYLAVEALTEVFMKPEVKCAGSKAALAREFGIDTDTKNWQNVLNGAIRQQFVFHGDVATYQTSRKVSDGFEHSFMTFGAGRDLATHDLCLSLARHVRHAIFEALELPANIESILCSDKYNTPCESYPVTLGHHGTLATPDGATFEVHGAAYPWTEYRPQLTSAERLGDRVNYTYTTDMQCWDLPAGTELILSKSEARGPIGLDIPGWRNATPGDNEAHPTV